MMRVFIFFILVPSILCSIFHYEDGTIRHYNTPRLKPGSNNFNVTAQITYNKPFKTGHCLDEPNTEHDSYGKIVLVMGELQGCERFYKKVRPLQEQGAVGILFARDDYNGDIGLLYYWTYCTKNDCDGVTIPLVEIGRDNSRELYHRLTHGENVTVELADGFNAFGAPYKAGAYYFITVISLLISFSLLCYAAFRLHEFVKAKGWVISLSSTVFALEIWSSICAFLIFVLLTVAVRIIWCLDPWAFYGIWPVHMSQFLISAYVVPATLGNVVLACYWQESIRSFQVMQRIPRLRKFKWPLIVFGILMFCTDTIAGYLRSYGNQQATSISIAAISLFYAVVDLSTGMFLIASSIMVLKKLDSGVTKLSGKTSKKRLTMFTILIITVGAGGFVLMIVLALLFFFFLRNAWLMFTFTLISILVIEAIGTVRLLIFQSPGDKLADSSDSFNNRPRTDLQALKRSASMTTGSGGTSDVNLSTLTSNSDQMQNSESGQSNA